MSTVELESEYMPDQPTRKHSHYYRLCPYPHIDVYRVLELFEVTDPALQHIIKKALCAGQRGAKDFRKDLEEIVDTGNRRIEMLDEDTELVAAPATDGGWIEHKGSEDSPVDRYLVVEVKLRNSKTFTGEAYSFRWDHTSKLKSCHVHDIIAYRLRK